MSQRQLVGSFLCAVLMTGCFSAKDETPQTLPHSATNTYQFNVFVDTNGSAPTSVVAAIGSTEYPMVAVGGGHYQGTAVLSACVQTFQLRYLVRYPAVVGSGESTLVEPPGATATYGGFLKTVTPVPAACLPEKRFVVNSTANLNDVVPGDGACNAGSGICTLRAAITEANAVTGPAKISLPAGSFTTTDYFTPTDDLVIEGVGPSSSIDTHVSIYVPSGTGNPTVELRNLTLSGGVRSGAGSLLLSGVTVRDSHPAIVEAGVLALGLLYIEKSTIIRSGAWGINFNGTNGYIVSSLIANNGTMGGLQCAPPSGGSSTLEIDNSTITGNTGLGGLTVMNGCSARLRNVTISGNTATRNAFYGSAGGGLSFIDGATVTLANTILSGNSNSVHPANNDCAVGALAAPAGTTQVQSYGRNLIGLDGSCVFNEALGVADLHGASASLAPLADNGGPTQTRLPLAGSAAIGAGSTEPFNDAYPPACRRQDQRLATRSGACDIGAAQH